MKVLSLPDEMRLFMCHDYGPGGRAIANGRLRSPTQKAQEYPCRRRQDDAKQFVKFRTERDAQLSICQS